MAEAHQGVAFSFTVTEEEGLHLNVSFEAFKAVARSGIRSWRKILLRILNGILNGVYPSHPLRGILITGFVIGLKKYKRIDLSFGIAPLIQDKIPTSWMPRDRAELVACTLFGAGTWLSMVAFRKYSLQALFSYHGWMYDVRGGSNLRSKLWMILVKFLIGSSPKLYSYQNSLPGLPVPNLKDTVRRYLRTVRPLLDDDNYKRLEESALNFQKGIGKRLQRYLVLKSYITSNYVSDWWEEYVYLRGRAPIMVNSNFYGLDTVFASYSSNQASRAANCIVSAIKYRRELANETLRPIMVQSMVPLCSRQYERQFNTTRIPGEVTDTLVHYKDSQHVAVYSKGKWFKLFVYYHSMPLNAKELELQLERILEDESTTTNCETYLGALTAGDRIPWAQARQKYFSRGINRSSLHAIEKAAFCLILDDEEFTPLPKYAKFTDMPNENEDLNKISHATLHGKGYDRWFDKSFNVIVYKNGKIGMNTEHSWADAPISGHLWEYFLYGENMIGYDEKGRCKGTVRYEELPEPIRLKWEFNTKIEETIMSSLNVARNLLNDVDLHVLIHSMFGKGIIKKFNVSPDAFIQMALQLAYYRDIGRHHLTYEASMTRMFREGRTETVRSCSIESCDWIKSMMDESASTKTRAELLRKACDYHQTQYRDSMTGKGVDRHIFCLYVVSKYLEIDSPFLKEVLSEPWRLSTSQTPTAQTNKIDLKNFPDCLSSGGGFGPVADDGYGVSYIVTGEELIFFHISSKKSSSNTDSKRFASNIQRAMGDLRTLLETDAKERKALKEATKA